MESMKLCAYNKTVDRFLSLDIVAAEFSDASFTDWMFTLAPGSGAGLWMVPFRGVPESALRFPLDLVYLDKNRRVLDVVESFPASRISPSSPSADSVLALPAHSIRASGTTAGDQLDIDAADAMDRKLKRVSGLDKAAARTVQRPKLKSGLESGDVFSGRPLTRDSQISGKSKPRPALTISPLAKGKIGRLKSWLNGRFFGRSLDSRKAPRVLAPPLAAHFWTGASPVAHPVRDISSSGLYVVTKERWYLGTTIRVVLTKTDKSDLSSERSICVNSRAVRWGNDGVGLHFVVEPSLSARRRQTSGGGGADRKELDLFLEQLRGFGPPRPGMPALVPSIRAKDLVTVPGRGTENDQANALFGSSNC
jgi:PilZ domain-containing protein